MKLSKILKSQAGVAPVLVLISAAGIIAFLLISNSFEFRDKFFSNIFRLPFSQALEPNEYLVKDYFGVSHPKQVIDFDLKQTVDPQNNYLEGPDGSEVPYQLISGNKMAISTDLPANSEKLFTIKSGRGAAPMTDGVKVENKGDYYEITNGLTGIRVIRPEGLAPRTIPISAISVSNNIATITTSVNHGLETASDNADIGFGDLDITITGATNCAYLNNRQFKIDVAGDYWRPSSNQIKLRNFTGANCLDSTGTVSVIDTSRAPIMGIRYKDGTWTASDSARLITINGYSWFGGLVLNAKNITTRFIEQGPLKTIYEVNYNYDPTNTNGTVPNGVYFKATIEVQAHQPSIKIEEDSGVDLSYSFNINNGLLADQARNRGHPSNSVANGYEADGRQYRQWHERPAMDAFYDLKFDKEYPSCVYTNGSTSCIARMGLWDPWIFDSGWYWQAYNKSAGTDANMVGIFAGPASRLIFGNGVSGPGFYTQPQDLSGQPVVGLTVTHNRGSPDGRRSPRVRYGWGLFVGTKGQDLIDPYQIQPIAKEMNKHSGINLNKVYRYDPTFPDPARGYGALYMERSIVQAIINKVRTDGAYYDYLYNAESTARDLIAMWRDTTGAKTKVLVQNSLDVGKNMLDAYVNKDGIYDFQFHYWHGGLEMDRKLIYVDQILNNEYTTSEDKAKIKSLGNLFGNILWDDDYVPTQDEAGVNLGTANMPVQQQGYRDAYALFLSTVPAMQQRAEGVAQRASNSLNATVTDSGAHMGSSNYIGASMGPLLNTLLEERISGSTANPFTTEPKLAKFGEFYMNMLTPPEVRFGDRRKLVSVGDGSTQGTELLGVLATGFSDVNTDLAQRLMKAWESGGKVHSGFHGTTLVKINEDYPKKDPNLSSATFPGYFSVLRNAWNTVNETALWVINGDFYRDHRHADYGSVVLYALKAPLVLDWGSMYSPQTGSMYSHNLIIPERNLGILWNQDSPALTTGNNASWKNSTQKAFSTFSNSSFAESAFSSGDNQTNWTRTTYSIHPNENYPVLVIRDTFNDSSAKISTLNLMAQGDVQGPNGTISPTLRSYHSGNQLPSNGQVASLSAGLNKFSFTGQWLIDWDLFTTSSETQQAFIGNWAHNWHPSTEQGQFAASQGRAFEERQHILRVRGNGPFTTVILPFKKGQRRADTQITQTGSKITISAAGEITEFDPNFSSFKNSQKSILTTFNFELSSFDNMSIEGGPTEVVRESSQVKFTAHGPKGLRKITLPGSWTATLPVTHVGGVYNFDYQSDSPVQVTLEGSVPSSSPSSKRCDLNGDGKVGVVDFSILLSNWGKTGANPADFNSDEKVNIIDFSILLSNWG